MNCHDCQPLLSAYVDESVRADQRVAVERHLRNCAQCRVLADDFVAIGAAAASLDSFVPPARVWHQLSAAVAAEPRWTQFGWFNWRPLTTIAMAVLIVTALSRVGTLLQQPSGSDAPEVADFVPVDVDSDPEAHYTVAIAQLEEVTRVDHDVLDQETAGVINAGMMVIDDAIVESRAALQTEPQSESARESLLAALRRKISLLQEMLAMMNEMRSGDQGAARILSEMNR